MRTTDGRSHLEINREVRRIMVANWIDLGRISIHTVNTSVYIRGSLHKLPGSDTQLHAQQIEEIHRKIRNVKDVSQVFMEFDNWHRNDISNAWEPIGLKDKKAIRREERRPSNESYDIG